jgi:hypothetical protein
VTPRATVLHRRLPHGAHRRPPFPVDLQPNQGYHEIPLRPLLLTDPKFCSGNFSSAPPPTASSPLSSSPLVGHLSEPLYVKPVPIESLGGRLAPRHHHVQPLAASWPNSAGGAASVKAGNRFPISAHGLKGSMGPGRFLSRMGRVTVKAARSNSAICYFSIRIIQI